MVTNGVEFSSPMVFVTGKQLVELYTVKENEELINAGHTGFANEVWAKS